MCNRVFTRRLAGGFTMGLALVGCLGWSSIATGAEGAVAIEHAEAAFVAKAAEATSIVKSHDVGVNRPEPSDGADAPHASARVVRSLVETAIGKGVPLYNAGRHEGSASVYTVAALAVRDMTTPECGAISDVARRVLVASLRAAEQDDDAASRAWTLRAALDVVHASAMAMSAGTDRLRADHRVNELAAAIAPMRRFEIEGADALMIAALRELHADVSDRRDLARVIERTIASAESTQRPTLRMMRMAAGLGEAKIAANFKPLVEADLPEGYPAPGPVGEVVIKKYPAYRAAWADGDRDRGTFMTLFDHIKRNDIAMTAPVEMTMDDDGRSMRAMAFLYGQRAWGPTGTDGRVMVRDMSAATFVSIGMRGRMSDADRAWALAQLRQRIEADGLEVVGPVRVLGYNSPMVPNAMKYSEVQIPVGGG